MLTALVVEDEGATLRSVRLILKRHGYNVLMAGDGLEALELIRRFEGEPGMQVDLLVTDLQMPRMGGLELLSELDRLPRAIPALVISAFNDRQNILKAFRNRSCYEFVDKPLDEGSLVSGLKSVMAKHEAELEHIRQQAEELATGSGEGMKCEMLNVIAHELNTPMNGIIGNVELMKETPLEGELRAFVEAIGCSAKKLSSRVTEIMELAELSLGRREVRRERFNLVQRLESVVSEARSAAEAKGLKFNVAWGDGIPDELEGDPSLLSGVVARLLDNAVKFTRLGGLSFGVGCWNGGRGEVELHLRVKDSGEGIPEKRLSSIFDSFVQSDMSASRRHEGLGLGLGYCRKAVHMLGGVIGVDSVEGQGSEFWVRVPACAGAPVEEEA